MRDNHPRLPSYYEFGSMMFMNKERFRDGSYQKEALEFVSHMIQLHGTDPDKLAEGFMKIKIERDWAVNLTVYTFYDLSLALVASQNLEVVSEVLNHQRGPIGIISTAMRQLECLMEIDHIKQFCAKGALPGWIFCNAFNLSMSNLALKIVMDDNPQAFALFESEDPKGAIEALARAVYDPFSKIRNVLGALGTPSDAEMNARLRNQINSLSISENTPLLNPVMPCTIGAKNTLSCTPLTSIDHGLAKFPFYLDLIRRNASDVLTRFAALRNDDTRPWSIEQRTLRLSMMRDFEEAGISRPDILVISILNYEGTSFSEFYPQLPAKKHAIYLELLVNKAVEYAAEPDGLLSERRIFLINHLIRQEPRELVESLCTSEAHWLAVYVATQDEKYLSKLSNRMDEVLAGDLGL